jgi:hypothetical protein
VLVETLLAEDPVDFQRLDATAPLDRGQQRLDQLLVEIMLGDQRCTRISER